MNDGMVSGLAAVDDWYYINQLIPRTSSLTFEHVWMQTRDPRAAIPSIAMALRVNFWRWQEQHTGIVGDLEPAILRAMRFWAAWVPKAEARKPEWTYKLENIETAWPEMISRLGHAPVKMPEIEPSRFKSGQAPISWSDMEAISHADASRVREVAQRIGYG